MDLDPLLGACRDICGVPGPTAICGSRNFAATRSGVPRVQHRIVHALRKLDRGRRVAHAHPVPGNIRARLSGADRREDVVARAALEQER